MTGTILDEWTALRQQIEQASDLIVRCTGDATEIKPTSQTVMAYLQAPDLEWDMWGNEWTGTYTLVLTSGTYMSQGTAVQTILQAIQDLMDVGINMTDGYSASWKLADSTDLIAAYELTVKPDGTTERMMQNDSQN